MKQDFNAANANRSSWNLATFSTPSSPAMLGCTSAALMAAGVVTAVVAFTVPAAAAICSIAAIATASVALLVGTVALALHYFSKGRPINNPEPEVQTTNRQNQQYSNPRPTIQTTNRQNQQYSNPRPTIQTTNRQKPPINNPKTKVQISNPKPKVQTTNRQKPENNKPATLADFSPEVQDAITGRGISDQDKLNELAGFDPEVQLAIIQAKAFQPWALEILRDCEPSEALILLRRRNPFYCDPMMGVRLNSEDLCQLRPEIIKSLLNNSECASIIMGFNFDEYPEDLPSLNFGKCSKLMSIACHDKCEEISGLGSSPYLRFVNLQGCKNLKPNIVQNLSQIQRKNVEISCGGSNLVIKDLKSLEANFAPGGDWHRFLVNHPGAEIRELIVVNKEFTREQAQEIIEKNFKYFKLDQPNSYEDYCNVIPKKPEEILSATALKFYEEVSQTGDFQLSSLAKPEWSSLTPEDFSDILHCIAQELCDNKLEFDLRNVDKNAAVAKMFDGMEEFNLLEFINLQELILESGSKLKHLPNLGKCTALKKLVLGGNLKNLDADSIVPDLLKLNSLKELTLNSPNFAKWNRLFKTKAKSVIADLFKNNSNLETITICGKQYNRGDFRFAK